MTVDDISCHIYRGHLRQQKPHKKYVHCTALHGEKGRSCFYTPTCIMNYDPNKDSLLSTGIKPSSMLSECHLVAIISFLTFFVAVLGCANLRQSFQSITVQRNTIHGVPLREISCTFAQDLIPSTVTKHFAKVI